jgi:hypothetical protein
MARTHIVFEGGPELLIDGDVDEIVAALTGAGPFFRLTTFDGRRVSVRAENIAYIEDTVDAAALVALAQQVAADWAAFS